MNNRKAIARGASASIEEKEEVSVMKLTIERANNGFLVRSEDGLVSAVFEDKEDHYFSERDAGYHMLWEVINFFDLRGSKHDAKRLAVVIEELKEDVEEPSPKKKKKDKSKA